MRVSTPTILGLVALMASALPRHVSALPSWGTSIAATWVGSFGWTEWIEAGATSAPSPAVAVAYPPTFAAPSGLLQMLGTPQTLYSFSPTAQAWQQTAPVPLLDRIAPAACTNPLDNVWYIYGGQVADGSGDVLDDLWVYDTTILYDYDPIENLSPWALISGNGTVPSNAPPDPVNLHPGARRGASLFCLGNDIVLLFGGSAVVTGQTNLAVMNDLWQFNTLSRQWTLLSAGAPDSKGEYGPVGENGTSYVPPARELASSWYWAANNAIYVFAGSNNASTSFTQPVPPPQTLLGDFWRFDLEQEQWAWVGCTKYAPAQALATTLLSQCPQPRLAPTTFVTNVSTTVELVGGAHLTGGSSPPVKIGADLWSWDPAGTDESGVCVDGQWSAITYDNYLAEAWLLNVVPVPDELLQLSVPGMAGWEDGSGNLYVLLNSTTVYTFTYVNNPGRWIGTMIVVSVISFSGTMLSLMVLPRLAFETDSSKFSDGLFNSFVYVIPSIFNVALDAMCILVIPFANSTLRTACIAFQLVPLIVPLMLGLIHAIAFINQQSFKIPGPRFPLLQANNNIFVHFLLRIPWWLLVMTFAIIIMLSFVFTMATFYVMIVIVAWSTRLAFLSPFHRITFGYMVTKKGESRIIDVFEIASIRTLFVVELIMRTIPLFIIEVATVATLEPPAGTSKVVAAFALLLTIYIGIQSVIFLFGKRRLLAI